MTKQEKYRKKNLSSKKCAHCPEKALKDKSVCAYHLRERQKHNDRRKNKRTKVDVRETKLIASGALDKKPFKVSESIFPEYAFKRTKSGRLKKVKLIHGTNLPEKNEMSESEIQEMLKQLKENRTTLKGEFDIDGIIKEPNERAMSEKEMQEEWRKFENQQKRFNAKLERVKKDIEPFFAPWRNKSKTGF